MRDAWAEDLIVNPLFAFRDLTDQSVEDAKFILVKGKMRLTLRSLTRNGELGATDLLAAEQVADGFNRLELKIEVGFKVEFHSRCFRKASDMNGHSLDIRAQFLDESKYVKAWLYSSLAFSAPLTFHGLFPPREINSTLA